ncbi:MAG TPA: hypothetical protein PKX00_16355 [Opitutaceae bacterium]|jgi:hypothetical protein|nr:hypothetical protein [Opitutaceae bacterium]HRE07188.1 hypothetical protein [Opitutaceae bacterium]
MESPTISDRLRQVRPAVALITAFAVFGLAGCSSVAPSKTATGAGTGAAAGAVVGGLGAGATGGNSSTGILAGAAAGAIIGGVVGMVKDAKERKEQDRLAQERAYQQELSRKRAEEAKRKAEVEEELAVTQGFRISDMELADAQKKVESATERLQRLKDERTAALNKKRSLDEANERLLATEAEIARMEEELARLKSDDAATGSLNAAPPAPAPAGPEKPSP